MLDKTFTNEALDFITEEHGYIVFETLGEYVKYMFDETNFSDAMYELKSVDRNLGGAYVLAQDKYSFFGNSEEVFMEDDLMYFFEENDFDGEIFNEGLD